MFQQARRPESWKKHSLTSEPYKNRLLQIRVGRNTPGNAKQNKKQEGKKPVVGQGLVKYSGSMPSPALLLPTDVSRCYPLLQSLCYVLLFLPALSSSFVSHFHSCSFGSMIEAINSCLHICNKNSFCKSNSSSLSMVTQMIQNRWQFRGLTAALITDQDREQYSVTQGNSNNEILYIYLGITSICEELKDTRNGLKALFPWNSCYFLSKM